MAKPKKQKTAPRRPAVPRRKPVHPKRNGAKRTAPRKRKTQHWKKRNPDELAEAAALYQQFHGKAPTSVKEYSQGAKYPHTLAELGRLMALKLHLVDGDKATVKFPEKPGVKVCATPDGRSLYLVGGDQALSDSELQHLNIEDADKDHLTIGSVGQIRYFTRKGFHNFDPIEYVHNFGEEGGSYPTLHYDTRNNLLYLSGGSYVVKPEGIVN